MRFLHSGDWHIGKPLRDRNRMDEYEKALRQVLDIARDREIDCLLVAGDIYDSQAPHPDAERLVFDFLRDLWAHGIPAVVVSGNHDHPRRFSAISRILELARIHVRGELLSVSRGGLIEVAGRDGKENACIAALPWVPERRVVEVAALMGGDHGPFTQYADAVGDMINHLATGFRSDTVNVLVAHIMVDGAVVPSGGGERPLHLGQTYAVSPQRFPASASYIALGHLHEPQEISRAPQTRYAGSLIQLDFGERGRQKSVTIVEAHPGRPPDVELVPITAGRNLRDVSVTLSDLATLAGAFGDDYLRVSVKAPHPVPGLAATVREVLPNAVAVEAEYPEAAAKATNRDLTNLSSEQLLQRYHRDTYDGDIPPPVLELFRKLHDEVHHASS